MSFNLLRAFTGVTIVSCENIIHVLYFEGITKLHFLRLQSFLILVLSHKYVLFKFKKIKSQINFVCSEIISEYHSHVCEG